MNEKEIKQKLKRVYSWLGYQKGMSYIFKTTKDDFGFLKFYILIVVMNCCMPTNKMMSCYTETNILK